MKSTKLVLLIYFLYSLWLILCFMLNPIFFFINIYVLIFLTWFVLIFSDPLRSFLYDIIVHSFLLIYCWAAILCFMFDSASTPLIFYIYFILSLILLLCFIFDSVNFFFGNLLINLIFFLIRFSIRIIIYLKRFK